MTKRLFQLVVNGRETRRSAHLALPRTWELHEGETNCMLNLRGGKNWQSSYISVLTYTWVFTGEFFFSVPQMASPCRWRRVIKQREGAKEKRGEWGRGVCTEASGKIAARWRTGESEPTEIESLKRRTCWNDRSRWREEWRMDGEMKER